MIRPSRALGFAIWLALAAVGAPSAGADAGGGEAAVAIDACDAPCEGELSGGECPVGCDDCGCCPGLGVAIAPETSMPDPAPGAVARACPAPGRAPLGVSRRVLRPPRAAPI